MSGAETLTISVGGSPEVGGAAATATPLALEVANGVGVGVGSAVATGVGVGVAFGFGVDLVVGLGVAAGRGEVAENVAAVRGTGWIETYRPSQIIGLGRYFHGVKNVRNWATVRLLSGRMSYPYVRL